MQEVYDFANEKMTKSVKSLHNEYVSMRAGKASVSLLDKVVVDYYGCPTPVQQMAAVSVSEGRNLVIQPWDVSTINAIEKAIQASDLGVNPMNDGKVIRLNFPPLTEEKRKLLAKEVGKYAEEAKVAVRSIRRDAMEKLKKLNKDKAITEDELHDGEDEVQKITDKYVKEIDDMAKKKEADIMEIGFFGLFFRNTASNFARSTDSTPSLIFLVLRKKHRRKMILGFGLSFPNTASNFA